MLSGESAGDDSVPEMLTPAEAERVFASCQELKGGVRGLQKALRRFVDASRALSAESFTFADEMIKVTRTCERESYAARWGVYFANTLKAVGSMQEQMCDGLLRASERGVGAYAEYDFQEASEARRRRDRLKAEHDALHARAASQRSGAAVASVAPELERLERALVGCEQQYVGLVAQLARRRDTRFMRGLLALVRTQEEFHERALKIFGNLHKKEQELERHIEELAGPDAVEREGPVSRKSGRRLWLVLRKGGFLSVLREGREFAAFDEESFCVDLMTSSVRVPVLVSSSDLASGNLSGGSSGGGQSGGSGSSGGGSGNSAGAGISSSMAAALKFCFEVHSPKLRKPLVFFADSELERKEWIKAIQAAISSKLNALPLSSMTPVDAPAAGVPMPTGMPSPLLQPRSQQQQQQQPMQPLPTLVTPLSSFSGNASDLPEPQGIALPDAAVRMLKAIPGNEVCAECGAKNPEWASINFGILLCLDCAGVHRSLGSHISKVRSLSLDRWIPEVLLFLRHRGNQNSNALYEANVTPATRRPFPNSDRMVREEFIRAKYLRKAFVTPASLSSDELGRELFISAGRRGGGDTLLEVARLLAIGADPNFVSRENDGLTPIFRALMRGNLLVLEALLQNGARATAVDIRGWTPMHAAAFYNRPRCLARLMQCSKPAADWNGLLPLDVAAWNNSVECVQMLRGASAPSVELSIETALTSPTSPDDIFSIPRTTILPTPAACSAIPRFQEQQQYAAAQPVPKAVSSPALQQPRGSPLSRESTTAAVPPKSPPPSIADPVEQAPRSLVRKASMQFIQETTSPRIPVVAPPHQQQQQPSPPATTEEPPSPPLPPVDDTPPPSTFVPEAEPPQQQEVAPPASVLPTEQEPHPPPPSAEPLAPAEQPTSTQAPEVTPPQPTPPPVVEQAPPPKPRWVMAHRPRPTSVMP